MTRLFWIGLFLAAGFANSIPDAWLPPLPVMVALFMCCPACIWGAAKIMNRANRNARYSEQYSRAGTRMPGSRPDFIREV